MFGVTNSAKASPRIKICGITNAVDALAALECGADALGFNFYSGSKRCVRLEDVRGWFADLPEEARKVGVVVNPSREEALAIARVPSISALQLHGHETQEFCCDLADNGVRFGKALAVRDSASLRDAANYATRTIVLDSHTEGGFGGSGRTFPWALAAEFVLQNPQLRVVLAGGLTPENVAEAVAIVRPFAVDVTSGVEASAGVKDHGRMRAFFQAVRGA